MATQYQIFQKNDLVARSCAGKILDFGLVVDYTETNVGNGSVRVSWYPHGTVENVASETIKVINRPIKPGDIVRSLVPGRKPLTGYCRHVHRKVAARVAGTEQVITGVDSNDLVSIQAIQRGVVVVQGQWVGVVERSMYEMLLDFSDGARCTMTAAHAQELVDISDGGGGHAHSPNRSTFYPGQQLEGPSSCFRSVEWIFLHDNTDDAVKNSFAPVQVTVANVRLSAADVYWIASTRRNSNSEPFPKPPSCVYLESDLMTLQKVAMITPGAPEIGEWSNMILKDAHKITTTHHWNKEVHTLLKSSSNTSGTNADHRPFQSLNHWSPRPGKKYGGYRFKNPRGILIQNDSFSSTLQMMCDAYDDYEGDDDDDWSDDYSDYDQYDDNANIVIGGIHNSVINKRFYRGHPSNSKKSEEVPEYMKLKPGDQTVVEVLMVESEVTVVWQEDLIEDNIPSTQLYKVDNGKDSENGLLPGYIVADTRNPDPDRYGVVNSFNTFSGLAHVKWMKKYKESTLTVPELLQEEVVHMSFVKRHPEFKFRPGSYVIGKDPYEHSTAGQVIDIFNSGDIEVWWTTGHQSFCFPQDLTFVGEIDFECPSGERTEKALASSGDTEAGVSSSAARFQLDAGAVGDGPPVKRSRLSHEIANGKIGDGPAVPSTSQGDGNFPVTGRGSFYMIAAAPSNHSYRASWKRPANPSAYYKRIREEIGILKASLPGGITIKSFENRLDLFSVMIEGPQGTPYEDGLFFFDVQLPFQYPQRPPSFRYISYCSGKLNPNLYTDGMVCVSLLGTWPGQDVEVWSEKESNLLRVLVSIQGLILVPEPYFNEPGFDRQRGTRHGNERSRNYNEGVLSLVVQSMTTIVNNPPEEFREEATAYIISHAPRLFDRLNKWLTASEAWNGRHSLTVTRDYHSRKCCKNLKPGFAEMPPFPILPASPAFCQNLRSSLQTFRNALTTLQPSIHLPTA